METQIPGVGGVPDTIASGATSLAQVASAVESERDPRSAFRSPPGPGGGTSLRVSVVEQHGT